MKKFAILLCSLALVFSIVGVATAVPWTWTDSWDPTDVLLNSNNKFYHYQHNINDDGFSPLSDFVTDYKLSIFLSDNNDLASEAAYISAPLTGGIYNFNLNNNTFGVSLSGLIEINTLGILDVTITRLWGDFYFEKSYLTATGHEVASVPVPEPGTMLMLGSVLLGLVAVSRKRFNNRN